MLPNRLEVVKPRIANIFRLPCSQGIGWAACHVLHKYCQGLVVRSLGVKINNF